MSTTPENAQNDRLELSELRNLVEYQADKIKALEAKLGALDGLCGLVVANEPESVWARFIERRRARYIANRTHVSKKELLSLKCEKHTK